jgi:hypothetical protein
MGNSSEENENQNSTKSRATRINSAQSNLQSHPCFQSSLYNDKDRAAGSLKVWKERHNLERSKSQLDGIPKKNFNKDYQHKEIFWSQSVSS